MELLSAFQQTNNAEIKQRLTELLGPFVDNQGQTQSYFDIYNHDLGVINQLLEHPPSETLCYQKAFERQEGYNQAMDLAKQRWEKGNKTFDVGKVLVKDLSLRKKLYQEALDNLEAYESKQKEIESFSDYKDPLKAIKPGSPWWQLQTIAVAQDQADLENIEERLMAIAHKLDQGDGGERAVLLCQLTGMHTFNKNDDYQKWLYEKAEVYDQKSNKNRKAMLNSLFESFGGRAERLKKLREAWQAQGSLVQSSTDDLIKIKGEIDNFSALMDMVEKSLPTRNLSNVDSAIKKQLEESRRIILAYRQQIEAAAIWRIKGAAQFGNLRLDDALFVLKRELSQSVYQFDNKEVLNSISDVASAPIDSITYGCNFSNFNELHKILMRSKNTAVQQQWLNSRWATNRDKRNLIAVTVKSGAIIPAVLADLVPDQPSYFPPSNWLRYWFFRTNDLLTGFWGWVRKVWVGASNEAVSLINETYRHVENFEKSLRDNYQEGKGLNLLALGQSSSFLDALEIAPIIEAEIARTKAMVTQGLMGNILRWLPFFKATETKNFSELWIKELERAQTAIKEKATKIAFYLMEDFEWMLLDSIEKKSFILPADLMSNLEKYIKYYGSEEDLKRLQEIASPIHVIRKFSFLQKPNENEIFRKIDEDNVTAFLRYAEMYWSAEQVSAIKLVVGIITRDNLPKNSTEDASVYQQIKCLLPENGKEEAFKQLMQMLAREYIFTTGDDGSDDALHFLERFAFDAARTWSAHRNDNLDEKFIFINNLLMLGSGEEKDLDNSDVQFIGTTKFTLQNFERYIKDLKSAEDLSHSKRLQLLYNQAKTYVSRYDGTNLEYGSLLFALAEGTEQTFALEYYEKRFLWLFNQENEDQNIEVVEEDERSFANIKASKLILAKLIEMVKSKVTGEYEHLSGWILEINDPELTAAYFGKRFEYLVTHDKFRELLEEGDFYKQLLSNPLFAQTVYTCLRDKLLFLVKSGNWDTLINERFLETMEKIGALQNKESYRLLRIKRLLALNNSDVTEAYIVKISEYLGTNYLENKIITLPTAKQLLIEIVKDHLATLTQKNKWEGHAQYFIEFYLPKEQKAMRQDIHLKWLSEFVAYPQNFVGTAFIERSSLDGKYHYQNRQIPNDTTSLADFYGEANLPKVRELIMDRLDNFCEELNDDVIQLINGLFRDPAFNMHEDWPLFRKKRDLFQQAQKTIHCLKNGIFSEGISQLENFHVQMMGSIALASGESGMLHQQISQYQQQLFKQILEVVRSSCKELMVSSAALDSGTRKSTAQLQAEESQQKTLMTMLAKANLPIDFKNEIQALYANRTLCINKLKAFVLDLNFEKLHLLTFDIDDLQLFSQYLGKSAKHYLKIQVKALKDYLPAEDPLAKALAAWYRVLKDNYADDTSRQADIALISEYRAAAKNFPQMAEDMAARLIKALDAHEELTYFPLFKDEKVSYQSAFMQYLSPETQEKLLASLKSKVEWILLHSDPSQAQFSRVDWAYHAKLIEAVLQSHILKAPELKVSIRMWVKGCLGDVESQLKALLDELDSRVKSNRPPTEQVIDPTLKKDHQLSILEKEHLLLKNALYVRMFGDKSQHDKLDQLLSEVARRQHRAMMKGASGPLIEHSLDFADKLISTAGSTKQREQSAQLVDKWNLYRIAPAADDLQIIRSMAVNDAIPSYIAAFEQSVYAYFVKKHNLPEDFHLLMKRKMHEWGLHESLLEPERILKKYPLTEFLAILVPLASKGSHGFFYSKPSESDARKLFVGFCLSIQANQLVKLWQNRQAMHPDVNRQFKPEDISGSLNTLVNQLMKKYDIGRGDFNKGLFKAIAKDSDYFASWSPTAVVPVVSGMSKRL